MNFVSDNLYNSNNNTPLIDMNKNLDIPSALLLNTNLVQQPEEEDILKLPVDILYFKKKHFQEQ